MSIDIRFTHRSHELHYSEEKKQKLRDRINDLFDDKLKEEIERNRAMIKYIELNNDRDFALEPITTFPPLYRKIQDALEKAGY